MRLLVASLVALAAPLLAGCGGDEAEPAAKPPPTSPPAESWDLTKLPPSGPVLEARTTPDGVRLLVLEHGDGKVVADEVPFDVHYTGYLLSGTSFEVGTLPLGGEKRPTRSHLLPGLRAGVEGLQSGERRRVLVPSAQAYGWNAPRGMPPGADLVFDLRGFAYRQNDLEVGLGAEAKAGSTVRVHYAGVFPDGRVFEESRKTGEGQPATLKIERGSVIYGWLLGVPGMRVGGRRRIAVPSSLAYGPPGQGKIPGHSDLIFTIDLLEVLAGGAGGSAPR